MSVSFKSAARDFKATMLMDIHPIWNLAVTVLHMAHAISRGRKPSPTISGTNIRIWWRNILEDQSGKDYMGDNCSILWELREISNESYGDPVWLKIRSAIDLCCEHFNSVGWPKRPLTTEEKKERHQNWLDRKHKHLDYDDDSGLLRDYNDNSELDDMASLHKHHR
jgi:hypothetical protein